MIGFRGIRTIGCLERWLILAVLVVLGSSRTATAQESGQVVVVRVYVCPAGYEVPGNDPYSDCPFLVTDTTGVANGETVFSDGSGALVLPVSVNEEGVFQFVVSIDYDQNREADPFMIDPVVRYCYSDDGLVEDVTPGDSQVPFPSAQLLIDTDLDIACDFFVDPITSDSPLAQLAAGSSGGPSADEPVASLPDTGVGPGPADHDQSSHWVLGLPVALLAGFCWMMRRENVFR